MKSSTMKNGGDSSDQTPQFFKIIIEKTIQNGRMGIPLKFVRLYGNLLSSQMILKDPTGKTWKVELFKDGNKVWLQKGWPEFLNYYSLNHGHLLTFKFDGDSQFRVNMFDQTAVEIEYPGSGITSEEPKSHEYQRRKSIRLNQSIVPEKIEVSDDSDVEIVGSTVKKLKRENKTNRQANKCSQSNVCTPRQAADNFTPKYPSFKVVLKSYSRGSIVVRVPFEFFSEHMDRKELQTVKFKVSNKFWSVNMRAYFSNHYVAFHLGWSTFRRENSLKRGDICIFELIKRNTFNVHIFKLT